MFRRRNREDLINSPGRIAWKKFLRQKTAVAGLLFIAALCVVSILGYLITPDPTPWANDQKLEISIKDPGFSVQMLRIPKSGYDEPGILSKMLFGTPSPYTYHPMSAYRFSEDKIFISEYTGNSSSEGDETGFNLAEAAFALEEGSPVIYDPVAQTLRYDPAGSGQSAINKVSELRSLIVANNIVTKNYRLGTDLLGRDLLSRLMIGARISLSVGLISVFISIFIGVLLGSLAGYFGGGIDSLITWLINVVWSIPTLLLVIAITLVLGKGVLQVFIAVGLTMWVEAARIVRGQILGIREKEFVEAGKALGFSNARIIFRHILPNVMGPVIVVAAANFATAILLEAGLSFLGLGAQPPIPSWGEMTNAHRGYILLDKAWLAFIPGSAIMLLVLAFMLVGNGLRDALDSRV